MVSDSFNQRWKDMKAKTICRTTVISSVVVVALAVAANSVRTNIVRAQPFSASQIQQLIAKVERLDRELARTHQALTELQRKYSAHAHRLHVATVTAAQLRSAAAETDGYRVLVSNRAGDATITGLPK
jgi:hypothetical protein